MAEGKALTEDEVGEVLCERRLEVGNLDIEEVFIALFELSQDVGEEKFDVRGILAVGVTLTADLDDKFKVTILYKEFEGGFVLNQVLKHSVCI